MKSLVKISITDNSVLKNYHYLIHDAVDLLNWIIQNPAFKSTIESFSFDWKNVPFKINDKDVFGYLFQYSTQHNMQIHVRKTFGKFGKLSKNILGTTIVGSNETIINEYWLSKLNKDKFETVIEIAAHLAHEYCHQRGFYDGKNLGQINVVPYFIGDLAFDIANVFRVKANIYK